MKYLNGQLRNELDSTMCLSAYGRKKSMTAEEYVPLVALGVLIASMLASALLD